jgi:hypothetical protein
MLGIKREGRAPDALLLGSQSRLAHFRGRHWSSAQQVPIGEHSERRARTPEDKFLDIGSAGDHCFFKNSSDDSCRLGAPHEEVKRKLPIRFKAEGGGFLGVQLEIRQTLLES